MGLSHEPKYTFGNEPVAMLPGGPHLADEHPEPPPHARPRGTSGLDPRPDDTRWNSGPANLRQSGQAPTTGEPVLPPVPAAAPRTAGWRMVVAVFVAAILGGVVGGLVVTEFEDSNPATPASPSGVFQSVNVEQTSAIAQAAASARPGVVRIESTKRSGGTTEQDVGSGVILDTEGHIITNAHVVLNTDSLNVILADGTERPAILVGHDYPFTDIAVLQIGPGKLVPLPTGDSSRLKLGETVIAIGNPLAEFDGSVSVGVVSGLNRVRSFDGVRQEDLIQTDAAVNNGNSGGALVNLQGQFVGMPTAVLRQSRSGTTVEGIAFALPTNRILEIAGRIIKEGGQYPRPSLQMDHQDLTPETLAKLGRTSVRDGAVVVGLITNGAASEAGIQPGDIVTGIGDAVVDSRHPLLNLLMAFQPGDTVRVVLNRNGRIIEVEVRLAKRS